MSVHLIIQNCLILNFLDCPKFIQDHFKNRHSFRNDIYLEFISEFSPDDTEFWGDTLTAVGIVDYWRGQVKDNHYKHDVVKFITDYGLEVDKWLLDTGIDLSSVSKILVRICW